MLFAAYSLAVATFHSLPFISYIHFPCDSARVLKGMVEKHSSLQVIKTEGRRLFSSLVFCFL